MPTNNSSFEGCSCRLLLLLVLSLSCVDQLGKQSLQWHVGRRRSTHRNHGHESATGKRRLCVAIVAHAACRRRPAAGENGCILAAVERLHCQPSSHLQHTRDRARHHRPRNTHFRVTPTHITSITTRTRSQLTLALARRAHAACPSIFCNGVACYSRDEKHGRECSVSLSTHRLIFQHPSSSHYIHLSLIKRAELHSSFLSNLKLTLHLNPRPIALPTSTNHSYRPAHLPHSHHYHHLHAHQPTATRLLSTHCSY